MVQQARNHRHPMALQAEVKKKLLAEGKIDEHGNRLDKAGKPVSPPPPPPPSKPNPGMLMTGATESRKPLTAPPKPVVLSAKEKLEALPDADLIEKADALGLNVEGAMRRDLIASLLEAGVEG